MSTKQKVDPKGAKGGDKTKQRSPAYPYIDLQTAFEHVKTVWKNDGRHAVSLPALAGHFDIAERSSALGLTVSALEKYGLFDTISAHPHKTVKLSDIALKSLREDLTEEESAQIIKQCALKPDVFKKLWTRYGQNLPSEGNVRTHLVHDLKFTETAANVVIKNYKATISFAKLTVSDTIPESTSQIETADEEDQAVTPETETETLTPAKTKDAAPTPKAQIVYREFAIPLPSGLIGTFKLPFPASPEDFEAFRVGFLGFKHGLIKKPEPFVLDAATGWIDKAIKLAKLGYEFDVINIDFDHLDDAEEVARNENLELRVDLHKRIAFFRSIRAYTPITTSQRFATHMVNPDELQSEEKSR